MADAGGAFDFWFWPLRLGLGLPARAPAPRAAIPWATPNQVIADLPTMRLRQFGDIGAQPRALVVAPFAVHDAAIADLATGHSLIGALAAGGVTPVALTEWKSATSDTASQSIDCYLADLNVAIDLVGGATDLVGLCQGGWMSLLLAAVLPRKVRRLALIGAPVDTSHPSSIAQGARSVAPEMVEQFIAANGGLVSGAATLSAFRAIGDAETDACEILQTHRPSTDMLARYAAWDDRVVDLPGRYYADVLGWLFRDNRLARDEFPAFGRKAKLRDVRCPLYLLAGKQDAIAPPPQVRAAVDLVGSRREEIVYAEADCMHLSLYLGARVLKKEWPRLAAWLHGV